MAGFQMMASPCIPRLALFYWLGTCACAGASPAGEADGRAPDLLPGKLEASPEPAPDSAADAQTPPAAETAQDAPAAEASPVAPRGCVTTVASGHQVFACAGDIVYDVEIPPACTHGGCGLIVDIHGWTMTGSLEDANTEMQSRGLAEGYVVVQPTAPDFAGIPTWDLDAHTPLVFEFLSEVAAALATDPKRAHAMGFSQGGGMTWRLACTHPEFFASVAPLGAITGCSFQGAQKPGAEVDLLVVHGHQDAVVSWTLIGKPQIDAARAYWPFDQGVMVEQDGGHLATRHLTPSGTALEVWEHDYLASSVLLQGHCVPGSQHLEDLLAFGCADPGTFVYGALAMQFFLDHPAP